MYLGSVLPGAGHGKRDGREMVDKTADFMSQSARKAGKKRYSEIMRDYRAP